MQGNRTDASLTATGFSKFWTELGRNEAAKDRFLSYLPKQAGIDLEKIALVSKGMARAAGSKLYSGRIETALKEFTKNDGLVAKLWDNAGKIATAEGITSAVGLPGAGAAGVIYNITKEARLPIHEAAGKMIASPQFYDAMVAYARSGGELKANVLAREKQLVRTMAYRSWEKALSTSARARIAAVGPLVYLTESSAPGGQTATTQNR